MGDEANQMITVPESMQPSTMFGLIDAMTATNGAIGYSYYYYTTEMYNSDLKLVTLDGVAPNNTTIADGTYPQCVCYYSVYRADEPTTSFAYRFTQYLTSVEGQDLAEEAGYVKLGAGQAVAPKSGNATDVPASNFPFTLADFYGKVATYYSYENSTTQDPYDYLTPTFDLREIVGYNLLSILDTGINNMISGDVHTQVILLKTSGTGLQGTDIMNTLDNYSTDINMYEFANVDGFSYYAITKKVVTPGSFADIFMKWLSAQ